MEQLQYRTILLFVGIHFANWQFDRNYVEFVLVFQIVASEIILRIAQCTGVHRCHVQWVGEARGGNIHEIC